jgi:hypothetical protein
MPAYMHATRSTEIEIRITCAVVLGAGVLQLAVKVALGVHGSFPDGLDLRRLVFGRRYLMDRLGMPTSEGAGGGLDDSTCTYVVSVVLADVREDVEELRWLLRLWCVKSASRYHCIRRNGRLATLSAVHFCTIALSTLMKSLSRGCIDQDKVPVERCDRAARPSVKAIAGPLQEWLR